MLYWSQTSAVQPSSNVDFWVMLKFGAKELLPFTIFFLIGVLFNYLDEM